MYDNDYDNDYDKIMIMIMIRSLDHYDYKLKLNQQHFLIGGLEHEVYDFPYIGNSNPNWQTHIFQRGRSTTNQLWQWLWYLPVN